MVNTSLQDSSIFIFIVFSSLNSFKFGKRAVKTKKTKNNKTPCVWIDVTCGSHLSNPLVYLFDGPREVAFVVFC